MRINDLIPIASGQASIGVNMGPNGGAFDITSIAPLNRFHTISGVFHDPVTGQSGVLRFSQAAGAFQVSIDGGKTFNNITAGVFVSSIGVLGGVDLTGAVDVASPASGFIAIQDTGGASPLLFSVDNQGLSGLWKFPAQGFNGRVVNALTDFNGTELQGVANIVGVSGIVVDIIGQTVNVTLANVVPRCFSATFVSATSWVVTHNLNSVNVIVDTYDNSSSPLKLIPDDVEITNANTVTVRFNVATAGQVTVMACY
jgi:hypothetical protein